MKNLFYLFCGFSVALLLMVSCNDNVETESVRQDNFNQFEEFVLNVTKGEIEINDKLRVVFKNAVVSEDQIGDLIDPKLIQTDPAIQGRFFWETTSIAAFESVNFQFDQIYNFELDLNGLLKNVKNLPKEKFRFSVHTIPLDFTVIYEPLTMYKVGETGSFMKINGTLNFNSQLDSMSVEKLLNIESQSENLKVKWTHKNKIHAFEISAILRQKSESVLTINWDLKSLKIPGEREKRFIIPSKMDFKVLNVQINPLNAREILISFSDFLDKSQELKGIVSLSDVQLVPSFYLDGNVIKMIYSTDLEGEKIVTVHSSIINESGLKLGKINETTLYFSAPKPALKLISSGTICTDVDDVIFPFMSINLNAVDVEITKVYQNNIMQFLQYNYISETYLGNEVSEIIWQGKVDLQTFNSAIEQNEWKRYGLNLMNFIKVEQGALYNIRLGFRKEYSLYPCQLDNASIFEAAGMPEMGLRNDGSFNSIWRGWYSYPNSSWQDNTDPCKPMYYTSDNFVQQNVLASNYGIMAKYDEFNELFISVVNLKTGNPASSVNLKVYSYQQQLITEGITDQNGVSKMQLGSKAYFIVATNGKQFGYLKLSRYLTLAMSEFDINGKEKIEGIDGIIYGERSVWRPGDTMFLNFVLRDPENKIASNHPVSFELFDPSGKSYSKQISVDPQGPVYSFTCSTKDDDKTGNWRAEIRVGPNTFAKTLKIETIKPNRLKVALKLPEGELQLNESQIPVQVDWLTGLPGKDLLTQVDLILKSVKTKFKNYSEFVFDDVARKFYSSDLGLFQDYMDEHGSGMINMVLNKEFYFPGKLNATFKIRAYEKSGEFSANSYSSLLSPYESYAGVKLPKTEWGSPSLEIDKSYKIPVVLLDPNGIPLVNKKLTVGLYQTEWRWWWDDSGNELAQYNSDQHIQAFKKFNLTTDGKGQAFADVKLEDYGSYMIRVCDPETGHCTGEMFYAGYYGGGEDGEDFASKLHFSADKDLYQLGDKVTLKIPSGKNSNVLITLENEGKVIQHEWVKSTENILEYSFTTSDKMFPNVYVHATVVQGLVGKNTDLPIRQYGVLNINVEDESKKLNPVVQMDEVIKPNSNYTVKVSENNNKEMFYTLAVVDEGLLDLTNFKTPDLYDHFYARQALLTKNWDNFDEVITGKAGVLDRIISIGGDQELEINNNADKANRFVPVVSFLGPFHLDKGKKTSHKLRMPNYSGAVRLMIVASNKTAYGSVEKSIKVKQDLMALITAPRVLSPGETIEIPVTIFVTDPALKEVEVKLENTSQIIPMGDISKMAYFDEPGEQIVYFTCKTSEYEGVGKLDVVASAKRSISKQHLEIDILNPNIYQKRVESFVLAANEESDFKIPIIGMEGTNNAWIEFSQMPPLQLEEKISYLIRYPYGCVEQTTSSVFPQLYLENLLDLSQDRKNRIKLNIIKGIDRLKKFQLNNGGMSYWPGDSEPNDWGSVYAAHFLVESKLLGYNTGLVLPDLLKYLSVSCKEFRIPSTISKDSKITIAQAYRLMVLARAGKPDFASMNYLFKQEGLNYLSKWYLAIAYSYAGKKSIGSELLAGKNEIIDYPASGFTYGSQLRDYAVLLQAYDQTGMTKKAANLLKEMINIYQSRDWWSTQTTSWFFMTIANRIDKTNSPMKIRLKMDENSMELKSEKPLYSFELSEKEMADRNFNVKNEGASELFVSYISQGKPVMGGEGENAQSKLNMQVEYLDTEGNILNIDRLKMGTEFKARIRISKSGLIQNVGDLALNQIIPSGWEILNWRMDGSENLNAALDYQDIRDDRVYSFFNLRSQEVVIEIPLHASYPGNYYLPQMFAEAMYDNSIYANIPGKWVEVVR